MSRVYLPEDPDFLDPLPGNGPIVGEFTVLCPGLADCDGLRAHFDQVPESLALYQAIPVLGPKMVEGPPRTVPRGRIVPGNFNPGQLLQALDPAGVANPFSFHFHHLDHNRQKAATMNPTRNRMLPTPAASSAQLMLVRPHSC